jgi:surface protein
MDNMFNRATNFNQLLDNWDTSNVLNMNNMFCDATSFNQPLNTWNTSNVTDMNFMFAGAEIFNYPLNNWNTSNVTDMSYMFTEATSFNQPLNNWNVSNVTDMNYMFNGAISFNQPLDTWNTSNVIDMGYMFNGATDFNQPLDTWNTSNVTNMIFMFSDATSFNQPLNNWDTSNVLNMSGMFSDATSFNQPLNNWDTSNVTDMRYMFYRATSYTYGILNNISQPSRQNTRQNFREYSLTELAQQIYNNLPIVNLTNSTENIELSVPVYDAISLENVVPSQYLSENNNNIIVLYNGNLHFSDKTQIKNMILDGSSIKFGCKTVGTTLIPEESNLFKEEPCFNMNSIGIISGFIYLDKIKTIIENPQYKILEIPTTPIKNYVSTTSLQMLTNNPNAVGASHCQAGQEVNVFDLLIIPVNNTASSSGGKRKTCRRKNKKTCRRKNKKTCRRKKKRSLKQF